MAAKAVQIAVASDGTVVNLVDEDLDSFQGNEILVRNTGTVNVLIGGNDGNCLLPLGSGTNGLGESIGFSMAPGDQFSAKVQTNGTAGQVTVVKSK